MNDVGTFSIDFGKRSQLSVSQKSTLWELSYSMRKDGHDEAVMRTRPTLDVFLTVHHELTIY